MIKFVCNFQPYICLKYKFCPVLKQKLQTCELILLCYALKLFQEYYFFNM